MEEKVLLQIDVVSLEGTVAAPGKAGGMVIFAHGSGSSRLSPRNRYVAQVLQEAGLGTLLFDLLTPQEDRLYEHRFDIDLLAGRLTEAARWLMSQGMAQEAPLGFFGASTGAAAALKAASSMGAAIGAVVSRGGRPDLAMPYLEKVLSPTLLIVGEFDTRVLQLNRQALAHIRAEKELINVPGATHLFEEPGTLEQAAHLAKEWFLRHLCKG